MLKIALISYEYPPETAFGGISTYMEQLGKALNFRKHYVEIFAASTQSYYSEFKEGICINRIKTNSRNNFKRDLLKTFQKRHNEIKFDILECAEFYADGLRIMKYFKIPAIIRLHGPRFLMREIKNMNLHRNHYFKIKQQIKKITNHFKANYNPGFYNYLVDEDYKISFLADHITSPSEDLKRIVVEKWKIESEKISVIPNPFQPEGKLLEINENTKSRSITFIGKLEYLKGIMLFLEIVPGISEKYPDISFRFIGKIMQDPISGLPYDQYFSETLKQYHDKMIFTGQLPREEIAYYLDDTMICIIPSLWENFPYVCLECMSAGRAVIASNTGGLAEIINDGKNGLLADPTDATSFINAIVYLIENPVKRIEFGKEARETVLSKYNIESFGYKTEIIYKMVLNTEEANC